MTSRSVVPLLPALAAVAGLAAGCGEKDHHLKVRGDVEVVLEDGTRTGFPFPEDTRLDDDRVATVDGRVAGHCTIGRAGEGEHHVLSVAVVRPEAEEPGMGLRSFEVRSEAPEAGQVSADLGGVEHTGSTGEGCTIERMYVEPGERIAAVAVECALEDADGGTAQASAELHYAGCTLD